MCHEQFHRSRFWDREAADGESERDESGDGEWSPSFLSDEEPDDEIDLLTDGGDGE